LPEVESVNEQYSLERKGRANKLHEELQSAIGEHRSSLQKFQFQVFEYAKVASSPEDVEMLTTLAANLHAWVPEGQVSAQSAAELLKKLSSF